MADDHDTESDDRTGVTKAEGATSRRTRRPSTAASYLAKGALVGRYMVLDVLGEGGMGVVYRAFDPELDRHVAVKLLQTKVGATESWLVREAQALARLSHPNVVAVFDVGTISDRVFVAMELVEGTTLRAWLADPRSWREVLHVMRAAGAGLAAAHAAGLVHRDFKPENVLVAGDGRVRVMDFGLARLDQDDVSELDVEAKSPLSDRLTVAGTVLGTPAYIAPELYRGEPAGPRSDQFAFGVALYEALYHNRPYSKEQLRAGAAVPKPPSSRVPAVIERAVLRAIAPRSEDRYASMDALLEDLDRNPYAWRRTAAFAAVAALAIGGGLVLRGTKPELCTGAERRLAGVWDPQIKQTVRAAFEATKKPFATQAYTGLERALDDYTHEWTQTVVESCEATRKRGEQTEEVLSLRETCLDQRIDEVHFLAKLLANADGPLVEKGDKVVFELEPIASCSNVNALRAPGAIPPSIRPQVDVLLSKLAEAKAELIAGHYLPSLVAVQQILDGAKRLNWDPLVADALSLRAATLLTTGNPEEAMPAFAEATWAAMRGKRDDVVALTGLAAAYAAADVGGKPGEAKIWFGLALAAAQRIGTDHILERRFLEAEGVIALQSGDLLGGISAYEKALAAAIAHVGADSPSLWVEEQYLGSALAKSGAFGKARPHYERALALREKSVGLDHPDIALLLTNLGACFEHEHDYKQARAAFERALAFRERYYGKNSFMLVATLDNFGELLRDQGDNAAAAANQERAIELAKRVPGTAHPNYHQLLTDYADTLIAAKRYADAHKVIDEALALEDKSHSSILPATLATRSELALAEHAWSDAAGFAERAVTLYEQAGGSENPDLWKPLAKLALAKIELGHAAEARPLLERALAIGVKANVTADELAPTRVVLDELEKTK
jgi:serine/threonine protein kinase/Tfp pilus assembly protein PilF